MLKRIVDGVVNAILILVILSLSLAVIVTLLPPPQTHYQTARAESLPSVGEILEQDFKNMEQERRLNKHVLLRTYDKACGYYAQHERYVTFKKMYPKFRAGISDRYIDAKVTEALEETAEPFIEMMYKRLKSGEMPRCFELDSKVIEDLRVAMEAMKTPYDSSLLSSLHRRAKAREDKFLASQ